MSPLEFTKPEERPDTFNTLLYGGSGNGKTMGALSAPGKILLVNADGPDATRMAHKVYGDRIKEVVLNNENANQVLDDVYLTLKGKHDFDTVVLDTMGEIYTALLDQWSNVGKISLPMRGDASTKIERYVRALRDLPINVVLVCQEQIEDAESDGEQQRLTMPLVGPRTGLLWSKVMEAMSIVGYVAEVTGDDDKPKWMAQLLETAGRKAKNRYNLGAVREVNLTEWFETAAENMAAGNVEPEQKSGEKEGS